MKTIAIALGCAVLASFAAHADTFKPKKPHPWDVYLYKGGVTEETGDVKFTFMPPAAGDYKVSVSGIIKVPNTTGPLFPFTCGLPNDMPRASSAGVVNKRVGFSATAQQHVTKVIVIKMDCDPKKANEKWGWAVPPGVTMQAEAGIVKLQLSLVEQPARDRRNLLASIGRGLR